MNSQICDGQFIKYPLMLSNLKFWLLDEGVPIFWLTTFLTSAFSPLIYPIPIACTCLKWKGAIIFWLSYFLWTWYDSKTLNGEGRKVNSFRYLKSFDTLRRYFPLRLIKLADLPPDRNYFLACFPHSVVPFGCGANFCTNTNKVAELFPDLDIRVATLPVLFKFPLARELFMSLGFCTTNKENILYLLNSEPAKAVAIFPGGSRESLLSHPGNVYSVIKNRKGFIRIALESGSPLVPVFSFGEQNTLDQGQFKAPFLDYIYKLFRKHTRGEPFIVKGRQYLPGCYGMLPHRRPITTVVGKPIEVPKVNNPAAELVDEYHEKFFKALQDLFEEYKHIYGEGDAAQLDLVCV